MADVYCDRPMTREESESHADTFAGRMEDIERRIYELGAPPGLVAQLDQVKTHVSYTRGRALWADR